MRHPSSQSQTPSAPDGSPHLLGHIRGWWLSTVSIYQHVPENTLALREKVRRSRLIAWLVLGLLVVVAILSPLAVGDERARLALILFVFGLFIAAVLNRVGLVLLAGLLLVALISGILLEVNLASPIGLTLGELPNFDAYVVSVAIAATVLPSWLSFVVAGINSVMITGNYLLQPHNANLQHDVLLYSSVTEQTISLLVRPIALLFILAVIAYLWVRGTNQAIQRAEFAEAFAVRQYHELQRTFALEEGVRYLHQTLIHWVEGDLRQRVPQMPVPILEQIRTDLNIFIERVIAMAQAAANLQRLQDAVYHLTQVLDARKNGFVYPWPAPSGTPLDQAVQLLAQIAPLATNSGLSSGTWIAPGGQFPGEPPSASSSPSQPSHPSHPSRPSQSSQPSLQVPPEVLPKPQRQREQQE